VNDNTNPPDTNGAVGPAHIVTMLNSGVVIQDRSGKILETVDLESFWQASGYFTDPRVLFDALSQRWIAVILFRPPRAFLADFLLATSAGADPTGQWSIYDIRAVENTATGAKYNIDYPTLGYSRDRVIVQVNVWDEDWFLTEGSKIFVFDKEGLASGESLSPTTFFSDAIGFTQVPEISADPNVSTIYLVNQWNGNVVENDVHVGGFLRLFAISGAPGEETLAPIAFPRTTDRWSEELQTGDTYLNLGTQEGAGTGIDVGNSEIRSVVIRNGFIWCVQSIFLPANDPTRSAVQWWQLALDGTVISRGRLDDPSGKTIYAFPSLAVNRDNDVLVGCARFAGNAYAGSVYAYRSAADPPGTLRAPVLMKDGEGPYVQAAGDGRIRWGDYSATTVDPIDGTSFWTIQEYATLATGRWGTWWGKIAAEAPLQPTADFRFSPNPATATGLTRFFDASAGGPIEWSWSFGDGRNSSEPDPELRFFQPGTYSVTLTVANRAGSAASTQIISVAPLPPRVVVPVVSSPSFPGGPPR